jgi:hypothetical protein
MHAAEEMKVIQKCQLDVTTFPYQRLPQVLEICSQNLEAARISHVKGEVGIYLL